MRTLADPLDRKLLAPLVIDEILFRLLRTDAAAAVRAGVGPAADAHRILEAMQFIRQNHADKLNVEQLARAAAMSPSHFAHRFSAVARVSPMRYLRDVRLDAARARLLGSGVRVERGGRRGRLREPRPLHARVQTPLRRLAVEIAGRPRPSLTCHHDVSRVGFRPTESLRDSPLAP